MDLHEYRLGGSSQRAAWMREWFEARLGRACVGSRAAAGGSAAGRAAAVGIFGGVLVVIVGTVSGPFSP